MAIVSGNAMKLSVLSRPYLRDVWIIGLTSGYISVSPRMEWLDLLCCDMLKYVYIYICLSKCLNNIIMLQKYFKETNPATPFWWQRKETLIQIRYFLLTSLSSPFSYVCSSLIHLYAPLSLPLALLEFCIFPPFL